jgi:hypothetical protein
MDKASKQIDKTHYETYITLAGGRIRCLRCTAQSTRTKLQCGRPALKASAKQKCQFHGGGQSSGRQTEEGRSRITKAQYKHGNASKNARRDYSEASAHLRQLEDAMYVLKMTLAPRTRGRKPLGYKPVNSMHDVRHMILDIEKHQARGSSEAT